VRVPLHPTATVEKKLEDDQGRPFTSREFRVTPKIGEEEFPFLRRTIKSDEHGQIKLDRIVPGLTYHIEEAPVLQRLQSGGFLSRRPEFDKDLMLAPEQDGTGHRLSCSGRSTRSATLNFSTNSF
jgi:hypothetical protein